MLNAGAGFAGKAAGIAKKMDSVSVRSYEYPHPGMYKLSDVEEIRKRLDGAGCKHVVRTREKDEMTDICIWTDNEDHWREMVVMDAEDDELSFVHLKGAVSLEDLSQLGGLGAAQTRRPTRSPSTGERVPCPFRSDVLSMAMGRGCGWAYEFR